MAVFSYLLTRSGRLLLITNPLRPVVCVLVLVVCIIGDSVVDVVGGSLVVIDVGSIEGE